MQRWRRYLPRRTHATPTGFPQEPTNNVWIRFRPRQRRGMPELEQTFTVVLGAIRQGQFLSPQQHLDQVFASVETRGRPHLPLAGDRMFYASHADDLRQTTPSPPPTARDFEVINDRALVVEFDGASLGVAFVQSPRLGKILLANLWNRDDQDRSHRHPRQSAGGTTDRCALTYPDSSTARAQ